MEMYAGHRGTFRNWLNIYKTNINSTAVNVGWLIQATKGSCNNSVEVELSSIFGVDANLISLQKMT